MFFYNSAKDDFSILLYELPNGRVFESMVLFAERRFAKHQVRCMFNSIGDVWGEFGDV